MYKLLLVEDDKSLGYLLSEYLGMKGFDTKWAKDGKEAMTHINAHSYHLVILDVMLPDIDGFELSKKIKALFPELPFLFLSARSLKIDVLKGFSHGAIDYLKKPIDEEELVVRISTLLIRLDTTLENNPISDKYEIGSYNLYAKNMELTFNDNTIKLTGKECDLLVFLVMNKNQICSHKKILTTIWDKNDYFNKKSLNVFIFRLRKYLAKDLDISIENIHGRGFILRVREE
jgi:DNA-binding response OmpR family regulator